MFLLLPTMGMLCTGESTAVMFFLKAVMARDTSPPLEKPSRPTPGPFTWETGGNAHQCWAEKIHGGEHCLMLRVCKTTWRKWWQYLLFLLTSDRNLLHTNFFYSHGKCSLMIGKREQAQWHHLNSGCKRKLGLFRASVGKFGNGRL